MISATRRAAAASLRGIYAIVNESEVNPVALTRSVLAGGVRIVQYRAKTGAVRSHAYEMRDVCRLAGALFIINDDVELALEVDADGVHAGPDDPAWKQARAVRDRLGHKLLGLSCGSPGEARFAQGAGADYIGVGSCFSTASKADAGTPIGIDGLRRVLAATSLPVAAIGGINAGNIAQIALTGAAMAAVLSALYVPDPKSEAQKLVRLWGSR